MQRIATLFGEIKNVAKDFIIGTLYMTFSQIKNSIVKLQKQTAKSAN
jgi:hypothetical protein